MRGEVVADPLAPIGLGFDDMARQHRAVRIEVSELRAMIDSSRPTQRTDGYRRMLAVLVSRLRERLVLHFELEQEGTYVARVRAARPEHRRGHRPLRHRARGPARRREPPRGAAARRPTRRPDVVAKTMQWLDDLRQHEQAEDLFLPRRRSLIAPEVSETSSTSSVPLRVPLW